MVDWVFFLLLLVAIATGYLLGVRFSRFVVKQKETHVSLSQSYFQGLNFLLNEQEDSAIDTFISVLEVNSHTLETHLALGALLRRRGEVDRAIRVHQNLLARPGLDASQQHRSQLELARDFMSAGLLDRAERLLQELVNISSELRLTALEYLVELYQDEQEWSSAIQAIDQIEGRRLVKGAPGFTKGASKWSEVKSHFYCELAQQALANTDYPGAREQLKKALSCYKKAVRASWLWGELEYRLNNYREALKRTKTIAQQDPDFFPEVVELICRCYVQQGDKKGLRAFLMHTLEEMPSNRLILLITDSVQMEVGDAEAAKFLGEQLKTHPSMKGVSKLIEFYIKNTTGKARENLDILKQLIDEVLQKRPSYLCQKCGFTGKQLHWLCPGCKTWGTIKSIKGVEGE